MKHERERESKSKETDIVDVMDDDSNENVTKV